LKGIYALKVPFQGGSVPVGDLAFVTSTIAWTGYGPVSLFAADFGKLYVTRDGGKHWQLVSL
jgi:hypothetical protein